MIVCLPQSSVGKPGPQGNSSWEWGLWAPSPWNYCPTSILFLGNPEQMSICSRWVVDNKPMIGSILAKLNESVNFLGVIFRSMGDSKIVIWSKISPQHGWGLIKSAPCRTHWPTLRQFHRGASPINCLLNINPCRKVWWILTFLVSWALLSW